MDHVKDGNEDGTACRKSKAVTERLEGSRRKSPTVSLAA